MALVQAVIDRLKEIDHPLFRDEKGKAKIAGAADFVSMKTGGDFRAPAAYVLQGIGQRQGTPDPRRPREIVWRRTVVIIVRAKAPCTDDDPTNKWAADAVEPYEEIIQCALTNWRPYKGCSPLIPVNTVPGDVTGEYVEIAFTFEMTNTLQLNKCGENEPVCERMNKFGLNIGGVQIKHDPCKEVNCEIKTNEGDPSECPKPDDGQGCND